MKNVKSFLLVNGQRTARNYKNMLCSFYFVAVGDLYRAHRFKNKLETMVALH